MIRPHWRSSASREQRPSSAVRVLLIDEHKLVRAGIRQILADRLRAEVGEADSAAAALHTIQREHWDVVLLNASTSSSNAIDFVAKLHETQPELPIIVLSMQPAGGLARRALKAGALGSLAKESGPADLVDAIRSAQHGRQFVGSPHPSFGAGQPLHETLSDREYQVLCKIAAGFSVSEIATAMSLSVKTVSTYRTRLLTKLGLKTNGELMRYALREGLVV